MRALRQLLGPWQQGNHVVPATFRQPNSPDARVLLIDQPAPAGPKFAWPYAVSPDRIAMPRGISPALIVRDRLRASSSELATAFARHESHDLPGMFVLGASVPNGFAAKTLSNARDAIGSMAKTGPTALELERARTEMLAEIAGQESQEDMQEVTADNWLLIELYKLQPATAQIRSLTLADLQRAAGRLFKEAAPATVIVGDAALLKSNLVERSKCGAQSLKSKP